MLLHFAAMRTKWRVCIYGSQPLHKRPPWVCSRMDSHAQPSWWSIGGQHRQDRLAGSSLICVHQVQRGREGAALWEHAAEVHFAICHNFIIGFWKGETTCQHKWTAGKRDNKAWNYPRWGSCTSHNDRPHKRGRVTHALVPCSVFSRATHTATKLLDRDEENQHGRPKIMIVCSPCMHVHIACVCVLLKIESGISRALFIAVKAFNPFTSGSEQRLHAFGEEAEKRSVEAGGKQELENVNLIHETTFELCSTAASSFYFVWNSWYKLPLSDVVSAVTCRITQGNLSFAVC